MKLIHQKNILFLLILTIFIFIPKTTNCMQPESIDTIVIKSLKKRIHQENKSNSSEEESFSKEPLQKKRKVKEKENIFYQKQNGNSSITKQFQCNHPGCNKTFQYQSILRKHMKIHLNETPSQCEECYEK